MPLSQREVSGHLFFNDRYFGYDDAIYATMRVLELVHQGFDYDKEYDKLPVTYVTDEINIDTTEEKKFAVIENLKKALENVPSDFPAIKDIITVDGIRIVFEEGWGLVRASNTTPKLVTRYEAKDKTTAMLYKTRIQELIKREI